MKNEQNRRCVRCCEGWLEYIEQTTQGYGEYHYPLGQKQQVEGTCYSEIEFALGFWWQTVYDPFNDHTPIFAKRYSTYLEALSDDSIFGEDNTEECYQAVLF